MEVLCYNMPHRVAWNMATCSVAMIAGGRHLIVSGWYGSTGVQLYGCTAVQVYGCMGVQVYRRTDIRVYECTGVQVYGRHYD